MSFSISNSYLKVCFISGTAAPAYFLSFQIFCCIFWLGLFPPFLYSSGSLIDGPKSSTEWGGVYEIPPPTWEAFGDWQFHGYEGHFPETTYIVLHRCTYGRHLVNLVGLLKKKKTMKLGENSGQVGEELEEWELGMDLINAHYMHYEILKQ